MILGQKNAAYPASVNKLKIYLPSLHTNLDWLKFLWRWRVQIFNAKISKGEAKIKEGNFIGPEVTQPFQDLNFRNNLNVPIQEPGMHLTMHAATFWEIKNEKTT